MTQHTPGPWRLSENFNWKTNPFSVTVRRPGVHSTTIANMPTRLSIPPEQQRANARLIAAAPELLEALENLTRLSIWAGASDYDRKQVEIARAAITKATGGQP